MDDLVVDEAVRGSGAGRALMAYAEADARPRHGGGVPGCPARRDSIL
ncbi:GNAT family N-acetyltransferase [Achromobacter xylosoxidans]